MAVDRTERKDNRKEEGLSSKEAGRGRDRHKGKRLPYEDLYYYPGHAFSPLHDIFPPTSTSDDRYSHQIRSPSPPATASNASDTNADGEADSPGISLAFYTLRKDKQGEWDIILAILQAEDGDERVESMERCLYPGAILHLPLSLCIFTSHTYISPTPSSCSIPNRPTTPPLLVPDLQTSLQSGTQLIRLSFRHPAISTAVAHQARREGVLGEWTKKEWGRVVRSGETAAREWRDLMMRKLDGTERPGSD